MNSNFLFPYDQRIVVKTCKKRYKYGALEKQRSNMKQECKKAPDREVRYVAFKSYHTKPPAPSVAAQSTKVSSKVLKQPSTIDQRAKSTAKKPPKKLSTSTRHSVSKLKGDGAEQINLREELGRVRQKEAELRDTLKSLETENESLKQSLSTSVPLVDHQQLQEQLRDALQKCADIGVNMEQLLEQNRTLQQNVDELTSKLEDVNRENAELQDRVELSIDQVHYWKEKVEELNETAATGQNQLQQAQNQLQQAQSQLQQSQSQLHQTQSQLQEMVARNEELVSANERMTLTLQNMQNVVEEQKIKMEDYADVKQKLKSTELQVQKVVDEKEVSSKFVELMESENTSMKQKNNVLLEQNAKLGKDLVEMKKKIEQLRQKFDEVNKENKVLKEKEARYLIHERINVSKYAKYPSTIPDRDEARASEFRPTNSEFRLSHYPTANVPKRAKNTNEFDVRLHQLLHRTDSVDRILKAKLRKHWGQFSKNFRTRGKWIVAACLKFIFSTFSGQFIVDLFPTGGLAAQETIIMFSMLLICGVVMAFIKQAVSNE